MARFKLVLTLSAIVLAMSFSVYYHFSMSTMEKWRDWQEVISVDSPTKSVTAVLEKNPHFGDKGYKPIIQVSLVNHSGIKRTVWASGEKSFPVLSWASETELTISYQHNMSSNYLPRTIVDGVEYSIALDMRLQENLFSNNSWEDWVWERKTLIKNPSSEVTAIVELGEHIYDGAAPILRVSLQGSNGKLEEVWSATEYSAKAELGWIDDNIFKISTNDSNSYSFYPAKRLDGKVYSIALEIR